jgi:Rhodanese-related sulfurtransferase
MPICRECLNISYEQAMKLVSRENALLIDVRSKEEYNTAHVKGSISIPLEKILVDISKYEIDRNRKIITYCSSGRRSAVACQMLHDGGYRYVYSIYMGVKL